jgi:DNA repair protein SbcC/Rad50
MLGWIFRKKGAVAAADAPARQARPAPESPPPPGAVAVARSAVDWRQRLHAVAGDDVALLALACGGAPLEVKLAAVSAIVGEGTLKLAEREFRSHDRRVHRLAKQRHAACVAQRETRERAERLLADARALVGDPLIPVNRLVELDRDWQALDPASLDETQHEEFGTLLAGLAAQTRLRAERMQSHKRWQAQARESVGRLREVLAEAAAGTQGRGPLSEAAAAARALLDGTAAAEGDAALCETLQAAVRCSVQVDERLALLDALAQPAPAGPPAGGAAGEAPPPAGEAATMPADPGIRWQQLEPIADRSLGDALDRRFEQWRQARDETQRARRSERREHARDQQRSRRIERGTTLAAVLEQAEVALAAGHLADTNRHLVEIDGLLHDGAAAETLHVRIEALQADYARLKGWQHWGGGRARDELVQQAEALAALTGSESGTTLPRLSVKQRAEVIDEMRARWKELDRLGGATSRALWQRFDAALKAAYAPVAAQVAAQRAAREQNLAAREQLLAALDAVALPGEGDGVPPDWKALAGALDHFQVEWRRLGPVEHTVPHAARVGLSDRLAAALARLEAPLNEVRRAAQFEREQLVGAARALQAEAGAGTPGRDLAGRVRDLQAQWQQQARTLPLARGVENALWSEFRGAIDAVFSARDTVMRAREAEFQAQAGERNALVDRLTALSAQTPPAELRRTLVEAEAQWQRAGPAPRSDAAALEARFRAARDAARTLLAGSALRQWQATCDALLARIAQCDALEPDSDPAAARAGFDAGGSAPLVLPPAWEQALAHRRTTGRAADAADGAWADEALLQLEAALQLDSPPEFQAARRELKLRALKYALEGRPSGAAGPRTAQAWLAAALERTPRDPVQRERLRRVVAGWRERGPDGAV